MDTRQLEHFRERLVRMRDDLLAGDENRREAAGTVHLDQQKVGRLSRMDAVQMQAMARAEAGRAQVQLKQIEAALSRLDRREYGDCAKCGEEIATARLEASPATPFCQRCAT